MDRRTFLSSVGGAVLAAQTNLPSVARGADEDSSKPFRIVDTHLHTFNTALEGQGDVPRYIKIPATIEDALAAMDYGGVGKAFLISYAAADIGVQARLRGFNVDQISAVVNKEYQVAS